MKNKKINTIIKVLGGAIIFYLIGIRFCPIFNLFHVPCPGCGLTRALRLIFKGQIIESFKYNILMFPILICTILYGILFIMKKEYIIDNFARKHRKAVIIISVIITAIVWIININNSRLY